jgi:spore coat polysaccharide biosynthesis predicted glycosyltransferase SpsG
LIENAKNEFYKSNKDILKPVKLIKKDLYDRGGKTSSDILFGSEHKSHRLESKSFTLVRTYIFQKNIEYNPSIIMFPVMHDLLEIESYQDWWVCEKLLNKKRIIFRVIGTRQSGMGHIYRCLTIAHEVVADHEVIFVSDTENIVAIKTLANYDYQLKIFESDKVVENIVKLSPDLVINDILSTKKKDIIPLKKNGIKVVSFEDLGVGAKYTDLTINELYDKPQMKGGNILWGYHYFFVRDEFYNAKSHRFRKSVTSILLTFGGTDQNNLMGLIYPAIRKLCIARNIKIHMVTGSGYINYDKLKNEIEKNKDDEGLVTLTNATGVISKIMEESQIAITSNGRTLYELAHMNMPAIVVSHHERESTHDFACKENGFISTGVFKKKYSEELIVRQLIKLLDNKEYRRKLFDRTTKYCFSTNKRKVIKKITSLLPSEEKGGQH